MTKKRKNAKNRSVWIFSTLAFFVLLSVFFLNGFLENRLKSYLHEELDFINKNKKYQVAIADIKLDIFKGNLSFFELKAQPTESFQLQFESGETEEKVLKELKVSRADIKGLSLLNFLWDKSLDIKNILIEKLDFNVYQPSKAFKHESIKKKEGKTSFSLDSLRIPGMSSVDLGEILVKNYELNIISGETQDTLSNYTGEVLTFTGLALKQLGGESTFFDVDDSKLELNLKNQRYNLSGGKYYIAFDTLQFKMSTGTISIESFVYRPLLSAQQFRLDNKYAYETYDLKIKNFDVYGLNTKALMTNGAIDIDSIVADHMPLHIFKDKKKPYDIAKRPKMPNEILKHMNQPLHIGSIRVTNAFLKYTEKLATTDKMVAVELFDLNATATYVTSIGDSLISKTPLQFHLEAKLLDALPFTVDLQMLYGSNSFRFSGNTLGTSVFTKLNPTVYPALGMQFTGGHLNGISFNARGNPNLIQGELTMYYTDLEIELFKKNDTKNKSITWLANTFVKKSNPNKNGKLIIGHMHYERVPYKGLVNYLWKSIQSGVVNSFNPISKRRKNKTLGSS